MKKASLLWLAATAAIVTCILAVAGIYGKIHSIEPINPADTITRPGALFIDSIQTTGYDVGAIARYKNLEVYIITGDAGATDKRYVPLQAALTAKMVTVVETGDVNELQINNHSGAYVYINSGDIVKGGRQDRTIQYDVIIAPHKTGIGLASFCVEHGRWSQRGAEEVSYFVVSDKTLSSKELKVAAKHSKSQQEVWEKVDKYQHKANEELNKAAEPGRQVDVRSTLSASSLQLTLDNDQIKKQKEEYKQELTGVLKDAPDACGLAYSINGKLYSLDLYNNHQLFRDLFDKLLDAAITEAISESNAANDKLAAPDLERLMRAGGKVYEDKNVNELTRFQSSETGSFTNLVIFTTIDRSNNKWLHRNWLDKTEE